jgi:hypothetical protein
MVDASCCVPITVDRIITTSKPPVSRPRSCPVADFEDIENRPKDGLARVQVRPASIPVQQVCLIEDIENVRKVTWTTTGLTSRIAAHPCVVLAGCPAIQVVNRPRPCPSCRVSGNCLSFVCNGFALFLNILETGGSTVTAEVAAGRQSSDLAEPLLYRSSTGLW